MQYPSIKFPKTLPPSATSLSYLSFEARRLKFCKQTPHKGAGTSPLMSQLQDKITKIWLVTFFCIKMRSLHAKFQPSSFQIEGGV